MKEYVVIYEWVGTNYSAYVPDLPGCAATGVSLEETARTMKTAMEVYIRALREQGTPIPEPTTKAGPISVAA